MLSYKKKRGLPGQILLALVPPLALLLHQLPQATAQLLRLGWHRRFLRRNVTPDPCVHAASAALDALAQGGALSQGLLLPRAPHLVHVDGPFTLAESSGCHCSAAVEGRGKKVRMTLKKKIKASLLC